MREDLKYYRVVQRIKAGKFTYYAVMDAATSPGVEEMWRLSRIVDSWVEITRQQFTEVMEGKKK